MVSYSIKVRLSKSKLSDQKSSHPAFKPVIARSENQILSPGSGKSSNDMIVITCSACNFKNMLNESHCLSCGKPLTGILPERGEPMTKPLSTADLKPEEHVSRLGNLAFYFQDVVDLYIPQKDAVISFSLTAGRQSVLGRGAATNSPLQSAEDTIVRISTEERARLREIYRSHNKAAPHTISPTESKFVDLRRFGAAEEGVSRQHVVLSREEYILTVRDLATTNGTRLNGARILPQQRRLLRNGDELQLGTLVIRIEFRQSQETETT